MKKTIKSELKLDQEEFNSMPGRAEVMEMLAPMINLNQIKLVDIAGEDWWANDYDTIVFAIDASEVWRLGEKAAVNFAMNMANLAKESRCDEFQEQTVGGKKVIRVWWD